MTKRSVHALSGILFALAACGDNGSSTLPPDASQTPDAPPDAPAVKPEGQVVISEARTPTPFSLAVGSFVNGRLLTPTGVVNNCSVYGNNMPQASLDAGSITITGTTAPVTLARETPTDVYLPVADPPVDLFAPGATLTVTSTGGVVPAFTGNVTAPAPLAGVVFPTAISRAAPPTLTWTAATASEVWVFIVAYVGANTGTVMICRTTDTGSFAITPAAWAQLPAAAEDAVVSLYRLNTTKLNAGAWEVSVTAVDEVRNAEVPINP